MKTCILTLLVTLSSYLLAQQQINPKFKNKLDNLLRGDINTISAPELKKHYDKYIVLDARERKEYNVSHIPNAQYIGYKKFDLKTTTKKIPKDKTVVVYCSVGYRSEIIARDLKRAGYKVRNLLGGIFEWSNQHFPLHDQNQRPTKKIHTYNQNWGKWVEEGEKVH